MQKHYKFSLWYVVLGIWVVLIAQNYIASMYAAQVIPYSQFLTLLKSGKVTEIAVTANQIQGKMKVDGAPEDFKLSKLSAWIRSSPRCWSNILSASKGRSNPPFCGTFSPGSFLCCCSSASGIS